MDSHKVAVLMNISAGKTDAGPQLQEIQEAFATCGIEPRIWQTRSGTDLAQAVKEALKLGFPIIAAAGGDGTVSKIAASLVGTEAALGLLPTGTLNHFAKDLNIPLEIRAAATTIAEGDRTAVDAGRVNDRIFINNASIGVYPQLIKFRERLQKRGYSKWAALLQAVFAVLVRPPSLLHVRMNVADKNIEVATNLIFIGNNEYEITGLQIGSRRRLDQNFLSLYLSRRTTRFGSIGLLLRALFGNLRKGDGVPDFESYRARELWIHTRRKELEVALDGELIVLKTPLRFTIEPQILNVMAGGTDKSKM